MHFTIQLGGKENRSLYRGLRYIEVRFIKVPLYVTSGRGVQEYNAKLLTGGGGGLLNNVLCGKSSPRGPTPHPFIYHQDTIFDNFNHFSIPLYHNFHWQMVPLSHTKL